ncbi:hypothetical protein L1049_000393 [Liquidambar formosana]|uniref:Uncharacterized protein n=1 Tax=Liquidambar formosana TaxID=63359 RepID=A0AAP0R7P0_LIQFO
MGGGGIMRAAGKVAGIGVINGGLRGVPAVSPAEHPVSAAARKASRPVSALASSSKEGQAGEVVAPVQRPSWEIDEWEFAGGEEELVLDSGESMARVVFGGVPTLEEAKSATSELKDALEKVYLKSPNSTGFGGSFIVHQELGMPLLSNSEYSETKACIASETTVTPSVPKHALQAFRLLNESPKTQAVVASIASDERVWEAVLKNKEFQELLHSQNTTGASFPGMDLSVNNSVADDGEFQDQESPKYIKESSVGSENQSENSGTGVMGILENIKLTVVDMVSNLSGYIHNIFGGPAAENTTANADADASEGPTFVERTIGASLMGLGMLVIMVVVLKRA